MKAMNRKLGISIRSSIASTLGLLVLAVMGWLTTTAFAADPPPNIILILADDLGYECIGANGGTSLPDAGAGQARRHRRALRALLRAAAVHAHAGAVDDRPLQRPQLHQLRRNGPAVETRSPICCKRGRLRHVHRGQVAAWPRPAICRRSSVSTSPASGSTLRRPPRYANPGLEINGVEKDYTNGEYGPDLVNDYALDFITRQKDKPFFLYYPMMLTHAPYQPTPDSADWDPEGQRRSGESATGSTSPTWSAYMDKLIGKARRAGSTCSAFASAR